MNPSGWLTPHTSPHMGPFEGQSTQRAIAV